MAALETKAFHGFLALDRFLDGAQAVTTARQVQLAKGRAHLVTGEGANLTGGIIDGNYRHVLSDGNDRILHTVKNGFQLSTALFLLIHERFVLQGKVSHSK